MDKFITNSFCPYCEKVAVPPPQKRVPHLHVQCTSCGLKPLAVFVDFVDDGKSLTRVYYVAENTKQYEAQNVRWKPWVAKWIKENGSAAARIAMELGIDALKKGAILDL